MFFKRITKLTLPGVAVLLGASVAQAQVPTPIDECTRITRSGSYLVVNNLPGGAGLLSGGECLAVEVNYVTIDLGGFVLRGDGTGNGIVDGDKTRRSIVVRNGSVIRFNVGVNLNSTTESVVEGIQANSNDNDGIRVRRGCRVTGNVASRNNGRGILVENGDCLVTDNIANENDRSGLVIRGQYNTVDGNIANDNDRRGILVECPSLVTYNTVQGVDQAPGLGLRGSGCVARGNLSR